MNHDVGRVVFAVAVGLLVAVLSYRWIMNTEPRNQRMQEEAVVSEARFLLQSTLDIGALEIVDPLSPDRVVGKTYVYPRADGWDVSGFYRRDENDLWHPYLIALDANLALVHLRVSDCALLGRNGVGMLEVLP